MMTFHRVGEPGVACTEVGSCPVLTQGAFWIDLFEPSREEERAIEAALGFEVPTREEMQKIETSNRLYREGDILFMTATILNKADTSHPQSSAVTFHTGSTTARYAQVCRPTSLPDFSQKIRSERPRIRFLPPRAFEGLIDAIVERLAEILERVGTELDSI